MDTTKKLVLHIAGLGAVGSHLVNQIEHNHNLRDKLEVRGWDFDVIEPHNIGNQYYSQGDVGLPKAIALHRRFPNVETRGYRYPSTESCDILVLAVDSMHARRSIFMDRGSDICLDTRLAENCIISLADNGIRDNLDYNDVEATAASPCQSGFHADKELVLQSVGWLIEQLESIVNIGVPAFTERRLMGATVLEWGC